MRRAVLLAATAVVLGGPAAAGGDTITTVSFGGGHGTPVTNLAGSADVTGEVVVRFAGSESAGCAERGVCGVSGIVTWRPSSRAEILLQQLERKDGDRSWQAHLLFGRSFGGDPPVTAVVHRVAGDGSVARCLDAAPPSGTFLPTRLGDRLRFSLTAKGYGLDLTTRCAGPARRDIAALLPAPELTPGRLRSGATLDFAADRAFERAGFAGTLRSTVRVTGSALAPQRAPDLSAAGPLVTREFRSMTVGFDVVGATGELTGRVEGDTAGSCALLDSCGASGTVTVRPASRGSGFLFASAVRERPLRFSALRRALRLRRSGPSPGGIGVFGSLSLPVAVATQTLRRPDGSTCADTLPLDGMAITIRAAGPLARFRLAALDGPDSLRTRCPGPLAAGRTLATGVLPRSVLGRRRFVVRLRGERRLADDGWQARLYSTLELEVRRRSVRRISQSYEVPEMFGR